MAQDQIPYDIQRSRKVYGCREKMLRGQLEFVERFHQEELKPEEVRDLLNLNWAYNK